MSQWRVTLGGLTLKNPLLVAAGTFGYGLEFAKAVRLDQLGGLIMKTLTRQPRNGNPPPRLVETPAGLLNAVGLHNMGLEPFLNQTLPQLRSFKTPVIVSLLAMSSEELAEMVQLADRAEGIAAFELNLSCPNLKKSGAQEVVPHMMAQDPDAIAEMVRAACSQTKKPVIAKLSPDVTDLRPMAQAAEAAGAAALSLGNTFVGMSINPQTQRSRLGTLTGGLSGPAIRPLAVYRVWYTAQAVRIPIIGVGGVVRADDAVEFILAGATAVAVGTANFADPRAPIRVLRGVQRYCQQRRINSLESIRGAINRVPVPVGPAER